MSEWKLEALLRCLSAVKKMVVRIIKEEKPFFVLFAKQVCHLWNPLGFRLPAYHLDVFRFQILFLISVNHCCLVLPVLRKLFSPCKLQNQPKLEFLCFILTPLGFALLRSLQRWHVAPPLPGLPCPLLFTPVCSSGRCCYQHAPDSLSCARAEDAGLQGWRGVWGGRVLISGLS